MTLIARRFDFRISCELSDVIEHRHKTNKKCQQISQRGKRDMYVSDSYIEWNVLFSIVDFIIWQSSNSRLLVWILTLKNEEFFMSASLHSLSLLGSFDLCSFSLLQCQSFFPLCISNKRCRNELFQVAKIFRDKRLGCGWSKAPSRLIHPIPRLDISKYCHHSLISPAELILLIKFVRIAVKYVVTISLPTTKGLVNREPWFHWPKPNTYYDFGKRPERVCRSYWYRDCCL